jgi:hypothetical protein
LLRQAIEDGTIERIKFCRRESCKKIFYRKSKLGEYRSGPYRWGDREVKGKIPEEERSLEMAANNQKFSRMTERRGGQKVPVKYLFRRQYQNANGDWQTPYVGAFTAKRYLAANTLPIADLDAARDGLRIWLADTSRKST